MERIFNAIDGDPYNEKVKFLPELAKLQEFAHARFKAVPDNFTRRVSTPAIFNQGSIGSCVGCSGKIVMGEAQAYRSVELSPMWIYQKGKLYDSWAGEDYSGTSIAGACDAISELGVCQEQFWPYAETEKSAPLAGAELDACSRKIHEHVKIEATRYLDVQTLLLDQCLWCSFNVYPNFLAVSGDGILAPHLPEDKCLGGHAVALTGWKTVEDKLYWEFQNSWGGNFGERGFFYAPAEYFATVIHGGFYYLVLDAKKADDIKENSIVKPMSFWKRVIAKIKAWFRKSVK